ncbi:sigma-70 family RNA polymerase sigma factor [Rossellomorea aquimaris]|uniref:sigma-70 family RNA polymerase sigma factor n=1 Tax=Rossellomorea aquimaris TaxID=189382 RepID=UPI001CD81249|nr:sigma-70 family RNA polymerase sigma factor [Rossellomorea aquimaris]MCA1055652.1 sigma-70 family RNA polymerase sigma factor [Rossellomorea aquimaris]
MSELDLTMVKRAKKGDEDALYQLITSHKEQLYRMAISYLKNEDDAIEAIQETTYRAYKGIKKLRKNEYFTTWLIRILLNYCHDEIKKKKRVIYSDRLLHSMEAPEKNSSIETEDAIHSLNEPYRNVIMLKYLHDLKISEIAEILECPEGTVKTWLHKGLGLLRSQLKEKEGDFHV